MTDIKNIYFYKASELKNYIGQRVWWDDVGSRWVFLRTGIIEKIEGRNVLISGDWYWFSKLKDWKIRSFKDGGSWKENEE